MDEISSLDLATEADLLYLLRRSAKEVLDGKKAWVRLIHDDFEFDLLYTEPQVIFTTEGPQRVDRALRNKVLKILQGELGMGEAIYREKRCGPLVGIVGLSEHCLVVYKLMFTTASPDVYFVKTIFRWCGRMHANRRTWYLVRTDTTPRSRLWRRIVSWLPFTKG